MCIRDRYSPMSFWIFDNSSFADSNLSISLLFLYRRKIKATKMNVDKYLNIATFSIAQPLLLVLIRKNKRHYQKIMPANASEKH